MKQVKTDILGTMLVVLREIIVGAFRTLAKIALKINKPKIICITGSVGKTSTKDMVLAILKESGVSVRGSQKSYNSEIGILLSIFGLSTGFRNPFVWLFNLIKAQWVFFASFPEILVLEVGLGRPGDISSCLRWLSPDISLLTVLPENPVHMKNFPDKESLYKEKIALLVGTKETGAAFYNSDDVIQKRYLKEKETEIRAKLIPYNEIISLNAKGVHYDDDGMPVGSDVTLTIAGKEEPFFIPEALGAGAVSALITATAIAVEAVPNMSIPVIRKAIASRKPTPGRMRILPGKNGSIIIDDSYNASPVALEKALDALDAVAADTKIIVLGKMAELGPSGAAIHESLGARAAEVADHVFILSDISYGMDERLFHANNHREIIAKALPLLRSGTIVLCKGSQLSRLEKVVAALLDESSVQAEEVLVRQERYWKK